MTAKTDMPVVDRNRLTVSPEWADLVEMVLKSDNSVRASKPTLPQQVRVLGDDGRRHLDYATAADARKGMAAYCWRMVAFYVSPKSQHQCMPICADFDLPGQCGPEQRALAKQLDAEVIDRIVDAIDKREWHGISRWGRALGYTGTSTFNAEGAVVYR